MFSKGNHPQMALINSSGLPRCQLMYASPEPFRNHHRHDVWIILFAITMVLSNEEPIMGDTAYGNVRNGSVCADLLV